VGTDMNHDISLHWLRTSCPLHFIMCSGLPAPFRYNVASCFARGMPSSAVSTSPGRAGSSGVSLGKSNSSMKLRHWLCKCHPSVALISFDLATDIFLKLPLFHLLSFSAPKW
jgi:hypothetical protein